MAGDSVGVLDHLGIERAHVVGASMGGMIAQTVAIRYPHRTLSLVSIMSNTGSFWTGQPALTMYAVLLRPAPRERSEFIQHAVDTFAKIGGSGFEPNIEDLHDIATPQLRPRARPEGARCASSRAIVADRDRSPQLAKLRMPVTVIHGAEDKLVRQSGGRATARAIPGAKLVEIPGMGHGLPRGAWPHDHRHDRRDRRARYPSSTIMSTMRISSRIAAPPIAPRLPLIRPEAGLRAVARMPALGRLADPVVVVGHHATAGTSSRPISSTISMSRCARCWRKMRSTPASSYSFSRADDLLDRAEDHRLGVRVALAGPGLQLAQRARRTRPRRRRSRRWS